MKYILGFTEAPGQRPFYVHQSDVPLPAFAVGSKILVAPPQSAPRWMQITAVGYQIHPDAIVTTVVVADATSLGGEGDDLVAWPW